MTSTKNAIKYLNKITEIFASEDLPGEFSMTYLESTDRPSDSWSIANKLLMRFHKTNDARGFKQWQKVNRLPKKGSSAIYILGPRTRIIKEINSDTGEEEKRSIVIGFKCIPVFRYEDTDGDTLNTVKVTPKTLPPLTDVAKKWGVDVRYDATVEGEYGSFSPSRNEIRLCVDDPCVFFHELAHKAHSMIESLKPIQDSEQEAIAQLTACTLAKIYNHNIKNETWSYIEQYTKTGGHEEVGRLCYRVLAKVKKVLDLIISESEKVSVETVLSTTSTKQDM